MFFFLNNTATTEISPFPLHAALPIPQPPQDQRHVAAEHPAVVVRLVHDDVAQCPQEAAPPRMPREEGVRSEEHTSELQSRQYLVCRLLLEKKKIYSILHFTLSS